MEAKTYFVVLDSRMEFSHSDMEMIFHRVHRYYPKVLRPIILKMRESVIGLYRKAKGEMTYNATYEHNGKRFAVKEQVFTNHRSQEMNESCNFTMSIAAPDDEMRKRCEHLHDTFQGSWLDIADAKLDFRKALIDFEKDVRSNNNKRVVFGDVKLHDICVIIGDLLGRFEQELIVLDYTLDPEDRLISVTFAGHQNKSHVFTITATDAR